MEGRGRTFLLPPAVVPGWGEASAEGRQAARCRRYNEAQETGGLTALAGDAWGPC